MFEFMLRYQILVSWKRTVWKIVEISREYFISQKLHLRTSQKSE